jgi:hypothetical protein
MRSASSIVMANIEETRRSGNGSSHCNERRSPAGDTIALELLFGNVGELLETGRLPIGLDPRSREANRHGGLCAVSE